jgi:hypothetical protein
MHLGGVKENPRPDSQREGGDFEALVEVEVENVDDLEIGAVHQNQVASDEHVHMAGRRRRQKGFHLMRTGLHSRPKLDRDESSHHDLARECGRKKVASREARRQVTIIHAIPLVQIAIVLGIVVIPAAVVIISFMVVSVTVIIVAVMPVVFVVVILSHRDGR